MYKPTHINKVAQESLPVDGAQLVSSHDSLISFTDSFLQFEKDHRLFSREVKGHLFWNYIRQTVFERIINQSLEFTERRRYSSLHYLRDLFFTLAFKTKDLLFARPKKEFDLMFLNYDRRVLINGQQANPTLYLPYQTLVKKYRILVLDPYSFKKPQEYSGSVLLWRHMYLYAHLKAKFLKFTKTEKELFQDLTRKLQERFASQIDILNLAKSLFAFQIRYHQIFRKFLRRYRPKMLIFSDNGNLKSVIEAASKEQIPTADLQHSLISKLNILYTYGEPPSEKIKAALPSHILSWGNFWTPEFRTGASVLPIGFPLYEHLSSKYRNQTHPNRDLGILITSVTTVKHDLIRVASELADLLPHYNIYYKLRPEEYPDWKKTYPESFYSRRNITMIDSNEVSLYEYLARVRYQMSTNTTVVYEGISLGVIPFILKTGWFEEMRCLYENGYAFLVSSGREIAEIILNKKQPKYLDTDDVFRSNSLYHLRNAVEKIIGEPAGPLHETNTSQCRKA